MVNLICAILYNCRCTKCSEPVSKIRSNSCIKSSFNLVMLTSSNFIFCLTQLFLFLPIHYLIFKFKIGNLAAKIGDYCWTLSSYKENADLSLFELLKDESRPKTKKDKNIFRMLSFNFFMSLELYKAEKDRKNVFTYYNFTVMLRDLIDST